MSHAASDDEDIASAAIVEPRRIGNGNPTCLRGELQRSPQRLAGSDVEAPGNRRIDRSEPRGRVDLCVHAGHGNQNMPLTRDRLKLELLTGMNALRERGVYAEMRAQIALDRDIGER